MRVGESEAARGEHRGEDGAQLQDGEGGADTAPVAAPEGRELEGSELAAGEETLGAELGGRLAEDVLAHMQEGRRQCAVPPPPDAPAPGRGRRGQGAPPD